jgi:fumarate hydratase subunit alpha
MHIMAVTYELVKSVSADLYARSLRKVPDDTLRAMRNARETESSPRARRTLDMLLGSAQVAETQNRLVCSDSGVPVYTITLGTAARLDGDIKRAVRDGFDELIAASDPPLLMHVTNPLTNERGYRGKDMPLITWDVLDGADYVDIICQPKALGSGRWAALEIFTFPTLEQIERYVMDVIIRAGSQHCPPVIIGVGIGGDFDTAAKLAKQATMREIGSLNAEPVLGDLEARLLKAANATGFGPMGTGGDTTALAVHVDYSAGHGYTPVAVAFNCWISRRTRARIYDSGHVERIW